MNGIHDMGGMQDMGLIRPGENSGVFHHTWERRTYALFNAVDTQWPTRRHLIESIPPADYLRMSYYERWLSALEQLVIQAGMLTRAEINSGQMTGDRNQRWHVLGATEVSTWIRPDSAASNQPTPTARFQVGQRVRAQNINPVGHTRLPRYARGKTGTIERDCGVDALPDALVEGREDWQHLYSVRFAARDLWGNLADRSDSVYLDLWEEYLELA
jgi:nitrile hydratase